MAYQSIQVSVDADIAHITLHRPDKRNAMNLDFWREFPEAIRDIENHCRARVIILSGEGSMFSSGMDLSVFMTPDSSLISGDPGRRSENLRRTVLQLQAIFTQLEETRIPVLAAVHGGCIGGALNLVCACDCRYATEDAYFSVKETRLGMTADLGVLQRLPHQLSEGLVRELAYTGRKLSAREALERGFINQLFPDKDRMLAHVMDIACQIVANSPLAVAGSKEMLNFSRDHSVTDSLKYMATWQSGMFQPNEMMKAFQANIQKQPADFDDLWPVTPPLSQDES